MSTLIITGTSTDVGKTIVTAALAAAGRAVGARVAVCKPAQTGVLAGEVGDLAVVETLAGPITTAECVRYRDPLAPETAAGNEGAEPLHLSTIVETIAPLQATHDVTLIEGAGGILVRLAPDLTLLDVAAATDAQALVVTTAGLGALNHCELTVNALRARGIRPAGLVIGSWPADPDLATRHNRTDLPRLSGVPLVGVVPAGAGSLDPETFRAAATDWFDDDWLASLHSKTVDDRPSETTAHQAH